MIDEIPRANHSDRQDFQSAHLARAATVNLKCLNPDFEYLFFDDEGVSLLWQRIPDNIVRCSKAFPSESKSTTFFAILLSFALAVSTLTRTFFCNRTSQAAIAKLCISVRGVDAQSLATPSRDGPGNRQPWLRFGSTSSVS